jgi:hypothetical protein
METSQHTPRPAGYALCFLSLNPPRRTLRFPCDARGQVELDGLSRPALRDYLYARVVMGRELAMPRVLPGG